MTWRPSQKNTRALVVLQILSGLIAAIGYVTGNLSNQFSWLFQLICIGGIVGLVYLLIRYHMTWFVYSIRTKSDCTTPGSTEIPVEDIPLHISHFPKDMLDFVVIRGQGNRAGVMECMLGLEQLVDVIKCAPGDTDWKNARKQYPDMGLYDYTITLFCKEALLLVFLDGNKYTGILIEPGEDMSHYLLHVLS